MTANTFFSGVVSRDSAEAPRLPRDAGTLTLQVTGAIISAGQFNTTPGVRGRGSIVDIAGTALYVTSNDRGAAFAREKLADGAIVKDVGGGKLAVCVDDASSCVPDAGGLNGLLADSAPTFISARTLNSFNADSLLLGGVRQVQGDGTTVVNTTAGRIVVANDVTSPLVAPEILFAAGFSQNDIIRDSGSNPTGLTSNVSLSGGAKSILVLDGAVINAVGNVLDTATGDYILQGGYSFQGKTGSTPVPEQRITAGAFLRVSNGAERFVRRDRIDEQADLRGITPAQLANLNAIAERYNSNITLGKASITTEAQGSILPDAGTYTSITSGSITITPTQSIAGDQAVSFATSSIALSGSRVTFSESTAQSGLVVTNRLADTLGKARRLSIASSDAIRFGGGIYNFGDIRLFAPALASVGGDVGITATRLELGSRTARTIAACGLNCDTARLSITVKGGGDIPAETIFSGGSVSTLFGGGVSLTTPGGIFTTNGDGSLDTGAGSLTLNTPLITDRVTKNGNLSNPQPRVSFKSAGALEIIGRAPSEEPRSFSGYPGSLLTFEGASVLASGVRLRSTAGTIELIARSGDLTLQNTIIEAPVYDKVFGTSDPIVQSASAGRIRLQAGRDLAVDRNSIVSVSGGAGRAGTLEIVAPNSSSGSEIGFDVASRIGFVNLLFDLGNTFDLSPFTQAGLRLGSIDFRTRSGDFALGAGKILKAQSVKLTADAGSVIVSGTIDTSGTNGGDIGLYANEKVQIESGAQLIAKAFGYSPDSPGGALGRLGDDARVAHGGAVTLGTDFTASEVLADGTVTGRSGRIQVDAGALIDVSAARPVTGLQGNGGRLIPLLRNGNADVFYSNAGADKGGTVSFRAPALGDGVGGYGLNLDFGGSIRGAREVSIEGFRRFDLARIAANESSLPAAALRSVIVTGTTASIDPRGAYFSDPTQPGGIVPYIQGFAIADSVLGQMSGMSVRQRPGIDLYYDGNIVLSRNWNLASGTVDLDSAFASGRSLADSFNYGGETYQYVRVGDGTIGDKNRIQSEIFQNFTNLLYRRGATRELRLTGEAPVIAFRAGGSLALNGSINDGFFSFREQTAGYLQSVLGKLTVRGAQMPFIPYSQDANAVSPVDQGNTPNANLTNAAGDPFGSMELFPRLNDGTAISSSSLLFAAGVGKSPNPAALTASAGDFSVKGLYSYRSKSYPTISSKTSVPTVVAAPVPPVVRTGSGSILIAASGSLDLVQGPRIYTAGLRASPSAVTIGDFKIDPALTLAAGSIDFARPLSLTNFDANRLETYYYRDTIAGILDADPVINEGGGSITLLAGGDITAG